MTTKKHPAYRIYNKHEQRYLTPEELALTMINHEGTLMWTSGDRAGEEISLSDYVFERRFTYDEYEGDIHDEEDDKGDVIRFMLETWGGGPLLPVPGLFAIDMEDGVDQSTFEVDEEGIYGEYVGNRMENPELLVFYDEEKEEWFFKCICRGGVVRASTVDEMIKLMEEHYTKCYKRTNTDDATRATLRQTLNGLVMAQEEQGEEDE